MLPGAREDRATRVSAVWLSSQLLYIRYSVPAPATLTNVSIVPATPPDVFDKVLES